MLSNIIFDKIKVVILLERQTFLGEFFLESILFDHYFPFYAKNHLPLVRIFVNNKKSNNKNVDKL